MSQRKSSLPSSSLVVIPGGAASDRAASEGRAASGDRAASEGRAASEDGAASGTPAAPDRTRTGYEYPAAAASSWNQPGPPSSGLPRPITGTQPTSASHSAAARPGEAPSPPRPRPSVVPRAVSQSASLGTSRPATLRPATQQLSDEQIIAAVQEGNSAVANELYHRLVGAVDITLYRIFGRREADHEDLIQRSFEQIVLTLSKRSYAGACSLRTWASAVTSRVAFNVLRSKKRERALLVAAPVDENGGGTLIGKGYVDAEGQNLARAELELLRRHLSKMNPDRAQAVFLHDVLGHELAEIAVMEDVSVAAAQSRLVRGRKELHRRLGLGKKETTADADRSDSREDEA